MKKLFILLKIPLIFIMDILKSIFSHFCSIFRQLNPRYMTLVKNRKDLEELVSKLFSPFKTYCESDILLPDESPIKDAIQVTKFEINSNFEFIYLGREFVIEPNLEPHTKSAILKTYELVPDRSDYGKKEMKHIPKLDIIMIDGDIKFSEDSIIQKTVGKNPDGSLKTVPINTSKIMNFNVQYLKQLDVAYQAKK